MCIKRGLYVFFILRTKWIYVANGRSNTTEINTKSDQRTRRKIRVFDQIRNYTLHVIVDLRNSALPSSKSPVYNVKKRASRSPIFYVFYCHSKNIKRFQKMYSSNSLSVSDLHTQKQDTLSARVITFFVQKFAHKNITPIKYIFTLRTWKKYFWKSVTFPVLQKYFRLFRQNVNITAERLILKYPFNTAGALGVR